ncbi:unnamed protein product, partial [Pylaiella littoralis]
HAPSVGAELSYTDKHRVETMRRALSILAASTAATTAGAFSVNANVNLGLGPNRGGRVIASAASGGSGSYVGVGSDVAAAAVVTGTSSRSYFAGASRRPLERPAASSTRRGGSFTMFSANPTVLQRSSRGGRRSALELSRSGDCGSSGAAELAAASGPFGRAPGLRRGNNKVSRSRLGRGRRG